MFLSMNMAPLAYHVAINLEKGIILTENSLKGMVISSLTSWKTSVFLYLTGTLPIQNPRSPPITTYQPV